MEVACVDLRREFSIYVRQMPPTSPSTQSAAVQASGCDATGILVFRRESRPVRPPQSSANTSKKDRNLATSGHLLPAQLDYVPSDSSEGFDGESFPEESEESLGSSGSGNESDTSEPWFGGLAETGTSNHFLHTGLHTAC